MTKQDLLAEIELYLPYAVPATDLSVARTLVEKYRENELILRVLRDYYTALPDACEEAVIKVAELSFKKDVHLIVLVATGHNWLYAVTTDDIALVAEYGYETPEEVLQFLGYSSLKEFQKNCPPASELKEYPVDAAGVVHCPACGVAEGEEHLLGCVVEVCPWCDGQLQSCNCRFEKLGVEEIEKEEQVADFLEMLEEKGRIPFRREQAPAYPGTSKGIDKG